MQTEDWDSEAEYTDSGDEDMLPNAQVQDLPRIRRSMAAMFCMTDVPFGSTRAESWVQLMHVMGSPLVLTVPEIHEEVGVIHAVLTQQAREAVRKAKGKFTLQYDKWTTETRMPVAYCLVASFIDEDWAVQTVLLDFRIRHYDGSQEARSAAWVLGVLQRTELMDRWSCVLTTDSHYDNVRTAQILEKHFEGATTGEASFTLAKGLVLALPRQLQRAIKAGFGALGKRVALPKKLIQAEIEEGKLIFQDNLKVVDAKEAHWRLEMLSLVKEHAWRTLNARSTRDKDLLDEHANADGELAEALKSSEGEVRAQENIPGMEWEDEDDEDEDQSYVNPAGSAISTLNDLLRYINVNPQRRKAFKATSIELFGKKKAPSLPTLDPASENDADCEREEWTVSFAQLEALVKARPVLVRLGEKEPRLYKKFQVPEAEWNALEYFVSALRVAQKASKDEDQMSLGNLLSTYAAIVKAFGTEKVESERMRKALEAVKNELQPCFERALASRPVVLATLLDPKHRLAFFADNHPEHVERVKEALSEAVAELEPAESAKNEIEAYFSDAYPLLPSEASLTWWKRNESSLPTLAQLARVYLAAQGSLATTDAVFATAGKACSTAGSVGFETMRKIVASRSLAETSGFDTKADLGPEPEQTYHHEVNESEEEEDFEDEDDEDEDEEMSE